MIFSTLKRGPWRRKPPRPGNPKRALYEARIRAAREHRDQDKALTWGCEYSTLFLAGIYRQDGCSACGRHDSVGPHRHHVVHRSRKGRAESLVVLCPRCHLEDSRGVEQKAMEDYGVDLQKKARDFAVAGARLGWLPVEPCAKCSSWHSARLLVDEIDRGSGSVRRLCEDCAPDGPP